MMDVVKDTCVTGAVSPDSPLIAESELQFLEDTQIGINAFSLMSPLTGIGQYTYHLVQEFQLLKLAPWLFYGTAWSRQMRTSALPGIGAAKNLFKRFIPRPYVAMRYLLERRFAAGAKRHKLHLYHDPSFMAYRFDGPAVITVHDLAWIRYPETHPAERVRELNRLMPETVERAAQILVDSEFVRKEVINHYGISPEKVTTTLLGVSAEFKPQSAEQCAAVLQSYGLEYGQYILAVGTLEPRKNLSTVIAAFAQLPEALRRRFPLVIAGMNGWGDHGHSDYLEKLIARGAARLVGYVPQPLLPALYAGARMLVYPSLYEGFGLPPLEAMACGVPVIASNRASLPEVVGSAGILVEPLDDGQIATHMQRLCEDHRLHAELNAAGQERATRFTWRTCALETLAIYKKAIAQG